MPENVQNLEPQQLLTLARIGGMAQMMRLVVSWMESNRELLSDAAVGGMLATMSAVLEDEMERYKSVQKRTLQ